MGRGRFTNRGCIAATLLLLVVGCAHRVQPWPLVTTEHLDYPQPRLRAFGTVHFAFDSTAIDAQAQTMLERLATYLDAHPGESVWIEGHASAAGPVEYNHALALRRAEAVRAFLMTRGVAAERLFCESRGESAPVAPDDTEAHRRMNRRVEIVLVEREAS